MKYTVVSTTTGEVIGQARHYAEAVMIGMLNNVDYVVLENF